MSFVTPAYLGWNNAERDKSNLRLYATDKDDAPRWAKEPGGRVAEYALNQAGGTEGDRYLIVRLGDRFTPDEVAERVTDAIFHALNEAHEAAMAKGEPT